MSLKSLSSSLQSPQSTQSSSFDPSSTCHPSSQDPHQIEIQQSNDLKVLKETKTFLKDRDQLIHVINLSNQLLSKLNQFHSNQSNLNYPINSNSLNILSLENLPLSSNSTNSSFNLINSNHRRTSGRLNNLESNLLINHHSLVNTISNRLLTVQSHLDDLKIRVLDRNSRILITGDLNSGKSTFVNALLTRDVAPTDQQPCTEVMCEILDYSQLNSSKKIEIIHAIHHNKTYNLNDPTTFDTFPIDKLSELVINPSDHDDLHPNPYQLLKVYISTPNLNQPQSIIKPTNTISLLRNGDISVSFIDSPGLNRDTLSTMELFAKQSTIDVVVFVVSAENQFTLSAQEFLWAASQEKAYVFVVVNKWNGIRDKVKAERRIRDQLRKLSPATWQERSQLVHFIDSQDVILNHSFKHDSHSLSSSSNLNSFDHLQRSLSSFVFLRRSISKLQPAQTYTRNLLNDLLIISNTNLEEAQKLYTQSQTRLGNILPRFNQLSQNSNQIEETVNQIEDNTISSVQSISRKILLSALSNIKQGKLAQVAKTNQNSPPPYYPTYHGLLYIFQFAHDVRQVLLNSLEANVNYVEQLARDSTSKAVDAIRENSVAKSLLQDDRMPERKFNPQAMFSRGRKYQLSNPNQTSLGLCTVNLGLPGFSDLIDFDQLNFFNRSNKLKSNDSLISSSSLIGSLGFGTLTLFGTGVTGGRVFVEALIKLSEIFGRHGARKWTGSLVATISIGFGIYLIMDIPRAIPRNIGKKLDKELNEMVHSVDVGGNNQINWLDYEIDRITKETRKVVRLAGWDLRERFRVALEEAKLESDGAKSELSKALEAESWLKEFKVEVDGVLELVEGVGKAVEI
ncbi:hypothetical protein O181_058171 [Austropuccinia psidii MF-1]|uniref:Dynamin-type G domain-containing protein n=1 Tax=Austropuccinia psidii MF-1 TaxID=1389203 RepID=A0A9Q3HUL8_9BASI|nr:hypothetical protein [Austropuccinia psidii MF-1]